MGRHYFSIAEITIAVEGPEEGHEMFFDPSMKQFSCTAKRRPTINITVDTRTNTPSTGALKEIFTTIPGGLYRILEDNLRGGYVIELLNGNVDSTPYKTVLSDDTFSTFTIFHRPLADRLFAPLEYPLDELLVSGHINLNKTGILLHSAAVIIKGEAVLFSGTSGAGKSTISELWMQVPEAEVITDERVILRREANGVCASGTPWHGTSEIHQNIGAPLKAIYFIKHGHNNRAVKLSKLEIANRLLVRCFPTFWHREGMGFVVDHCSGIAQNIPGYELEFVPDMSIPEFVMSHLKSIEY